MLSSSFNLVLFEQNDDDFLRMTELLRWHNSDVSVRRLRNAKELSLVVESHETVDIVLVDIDNSEIGGPSGLLRFGSLLQSRPVVAFGNVDFSEPVLMCLREGLQDFFSKWELDCDQLRHLLARALSRYKLVKKLGHAEKSAEAKAEERTRFLARMSHEIRTPLVSILGFSQLLSDCRCCSSESISLLRSLQNNGRFLLSLLDNVMTSAQLERGEFRFHRDRFALSDLLALVSSVAELQASVKGLKYSVQVLGDVPKWFYSDFTRLAQVLVNILINGVKYTEKGFVKLTVLSEGEPYLQFAVSDSGRGLPELGRKMLFQEFSRDDSAIAHGSPGVGLGLFVAESIVRKMGGDISIESEEGRGSTFRITVPLEAAMEDSYEDRNVQELKLAGRVLLVEDTTDAAHYITLLLNGIGLSVVNAKSAEECLLLLDNGESFNLILMDIGLPDKDGLTAIKEIRAKEINYPIIALSAHAFEEEIEASLQAGADSYLTKPFRVEDFLRTISERLSDDSKAVSVERYTAPTNDMMVNLAVGNRPSTEKRLRDIKGRFVKSLCEQLDVIRDSDRIRDLQQLKEISHKLAGSAGLLGYIDLSNKSKLLEKSIKNYQSGSEEELLQRNLHALQFEIEKIITSEGEGVQSR